LHSRQIARGYTRVFFYPRIRLASAELSAPDARINADEPAKDTREVRLIMHPAVEGDL
jgi:hypothetical protein